MKHIAVKSGNKKYFLSGRAAIFTCMVYLCIGSDAMAGIHLTLMSSGLTPKPAEPTIIQALQNTKLPLKNSLAKFYQLRQYRPIWTDGQHYNDKARQLLDAIHQAGNYGLNPFDYDAKILRSFLEANTIDQTLLTKSDIVFTHAFVKLASHIRKGRLSNFPTLQEDQYHLFSELHNAVEQNNIVEAIKKLQPGHSTYKNLVRALNQYKKLPQDSHIITLSGRSYELGDRSDEIPSIRKRLHALGDMTNEDLDSRVYDEQLVKSISHFQQRHGLTPDGILGKQTLRELNTPVWRRIQQLELNLARAQSLPNIAIGTHLVINIPAYKLYLYDNHQLTYQSNVVVGKKKHETPVISSELTKIILSPYWHVPKSITRNEIIPKLLTDPGYLSKNNMRLISTHPNNRHYVDPSTIDWTSIDINNLNFRVRQEPGNQNSLGNIKFYFPNNHSVYLHDTPSRGLFVKPQRAFSHGCIRLEDPFGLAEKLLSKKTGWSKYDLLDLSRHTKSKSLRLEAPVPIHLTYMTAWADEQGVVNFRPDIYNRDTQMLASLYNADL